MEVVACRHLHLCVMDVLFVAECSVQCNALGVFSRSVLFHFTFIVLFVPQVECRNLGFVWVCTQILGSVVLCEFAHERGLLSCDTQIVCVYELTTPNRTSSQFKKQNKQKDKTPKIYHHAHRQRAQARRVPHTDITFTNINIPKAINTHNT